MVKISRDNLYISTFSENGIKLAKDNGLGLELNHTCISENLDNLDKLIQDVKKDIKDVNKLILHGPFTEIHPASIDHRFKEEALKRLDEAYVVAKAFDIKKMVLHNGWIPFIYFKEYQRVRGKEFFLEYMKEKEIALAIENVLEDEPYMMKDMLSDINDERIGICLDIGHLNVASSIDVITWIDVLGKYIKHFHLHNNFKDKDSHNSINEGSMDILKVLDKISNTCSSDVTYTIESRNPYDSIIFLEKEGII